MKQNSFSGTLSRTLLTVFATFLGFLAMAQDAGTTGGASVSVSTNKSTTTSSNWYTSPWVWVIGAAVFILLLVALLNNRGNGGSTTTTTRTVDRTVE